MHGSPNEHALSEGFKGKRVTECVLSFEKDKKPGKRRKKCRLTAKTWDKLGQLAGGHASPVFRNTMHEVTRKI